MIRIKHDLHTHTTYSDGAHPVGLHILEARAFELDALAITDHHVPGFALHDDDGAFDEYILEIERERSEQGDLIVLRGVELQAQDTQGTVSLDPRRAERLEWILCDLGGQSEGTLRTTPPDKGQYMGNVVRTYLAICELPFVSAIAHPFNTGNTTPWALPSDYPEALLRELAQKMAATDTVFDVMNDTIYWFQGTGIAPRELTAEYVELVRLFRAEGVVFQVSSDDHRTGVGNTRWSNIVIERAGVPDGQVVDPRAIALKHT